MTEILLLHHAHGLTAGVHHLADRFRAGGHVVHTPDLYEGRVYDELEDGLAHAQGLGFAEVAARGVAAAAALPDGLVVAGLSLGAVPAQQLAQQDPRVRAALLLHACLPPDAVGDGWPPAVPVQVHGMEDDAFFAGEDLDSAREVTSAAEDGELFLYPGSEHLFTDDSLPAFDEAATGLVVERALALLARAG